MPWTTVNKVVLELQSVRLRDFSRAGEGPPALVCAPYALHSALIADFAPGHSIVEALQQGGLDCLYVTDWRSASREMRYLSIDNYLSDLNLAVDEIGPTVDLVGLCQGGWLSLVYAARFPKKVRRLVLVGAPVDVSIESELSRLVGETPPSAFEGLVGADGGIARGTHMLRLWSGRPDAEGVLQGELSSKIAADKELLDRFNRWQGETLDLPGSYYLQVVNWIFRENRLAKGAFMALGRKVHLEELEKPAFLLVGSDDEVVPAAQGLATTSLLGTPPHLIECATAPSDHLGLFLGNKTLADCWPRIAEWLQNDRWDGVSRSVAS